MAKVLGIDEAGRGPVIGSMFVCGFEVDSSRMEELKGMGLKDSKKLSDSRREELAERLREVGRPVMLELEASEIDRLRQEMTLNEVELDAFAEIVDRSEAEEVYLDLPEPDGDRFVAKLRERMETEVPERSFVAEHGADDSYPVVSAASILAKSARESHVDRLKQKYGYDFESGYPHDEPTLEFIRSYLGEKGELPPEVRESWSTAERLVKESEQSGLEDFREYNSGEE